jgi:hypothetical protein
MTPNDRVRISLAAARYLEALECDDQEALDALWALAANDPEMLGAFHDIHAGLLEESQAQDRATIESAIAAAVEEHLPSAEIVNSKTGPVTVADVAVELFRHPPDRLPAEALALNERLRAAADELPTDLGLSKLVAWAEARFGPADPGYWRAFHRAAMKLELRRAATIEYALAARSAPKREDRL